MWAHFNSLEAMKEASIDELANVESMNYKTAETLYFFRMSKVEKQDILKKKSILHKMLFNVLTVI